MLCCSWVKNICTNPDMQSRALSWLVIEIHPIQGEENQRRQVNTKSVYFFFLFPKREVRIIRVSEKGKKYIWKEKQIRKYVWRSFSQELFSVTYLCVWPTHAIHAWCITCPSWYLQGITRKLSDTRLMLIPRPISSITREDDIHYTSLWLSHSPRTLSLSPRSHHHTELLPLSPFGMDPNSSFGHFAPNSNH